VLARTGRTLLDEQLGGIEHRLDRRLGELDERVDRRLDGIDGRLLSTQRSTGETTTLRMQNMPAVHGVTTTYTSAVRLRVTDCAGNSAEDFVVLTFECTGT